MTALRIRDLASALRRYGLFRGFDDARLEQLIRAAEDIAVAAGEDVFREGDPGDATFVVLDGAAQVYTRAGPLRTPSVSIARSRAWATGSA